MRWTLSLFRNARQPQNPDKVPFKARLPMKLKNYVSSKNEKTTDRGCLHEITLLLTCLEKNEFEDKKCVPEIKAFNQCYNVYCNNLQRRHFVMEQAVPVPESKTLTQKQAIYLLQKYPTV